MAAAPASKPLTTKEILDKSMKRALGGGVAGAMAMGINVGTLMWMRTTINYQLRHGGGTLEAFRCVAGICLAADPWRKFVARP